MTRQLIVPVDGSPTSFRALDTAISLADRLGATISLVEVAFAPRDIEFRMPQLERELSSHLGDVIDIDVSIEMPLARSSVAEAIQQVHDRHPDALVVMSSHGRGRSAAVVGSVAADLILRLQQPIMLIGPNTEPNDFSGPVIAPFDCSAASESALPIAAEWAVALQTTPWIVNVAAPQTSAPSDLHEAGPLLHAARTLAASAGCDVEFEQLHGTKPARVVTQEAHARGASMIVASTHGRSGLSRVTMGSVVAGFVRHATCPVVVVRPPAT